MGKFDKEKIKVYNIPSEYIKHSKFNTAGRRLSANPISQEKCIHSLAVFFFEDTMKICKDGRIWGQINTDYHDSEYVKKQRKVKLGNKNCNYKNGKPHCKECGKLLINYNSTYCQNCWQLREKNSSWKGGITPLRKAIRNLSEYKEWRSDVFQRDNWTCQTCGACSSCGKKVYLEAHHIKSFAKIIKDNNITSVIEAQLCKELWDINSGVTLCRNCHDLTKTKKGDRQNEHKRKQDEKSY